MQTAIYAIKALWLREILKFIRDKSRLSGALIQPLGFWLLLGLGFHGTFQMPGNQTAQVDYLEYLYPGIVALITLFTAIFSTISIITDRQSGFLQAALVAPTPRIALALGSISGGATLAVGEAILFLLLAPIIGLKPTPIGLLIILLTTFLLAVSFTALGFIFAWRKDSIRGFHAIMNLLLLPMWFLSGAFFPPDGAPLPLRLLMYINPVTYGVSALRAGLYWPEPAPGAPVPLSLALPIIAGFTILMLFLTTIEVRKPLFGKGK